MGYQRRVHGESYLQTSAKRIPANMATKMLLVILLVAYLVQPGSFAPRNNRENERNNREHEIEKRSPAGHSLEEEARNNRENERNNRENERNNREKRSPSENERNN